MTYTLWSHGRLLGELELTPMVCSSSRLKGDLRSTDAGDAVLPIATGVMRIAVERGGMRHQSNRSIKRLPGAGGDASDGDEDEHAEFRAAVEARATLHLELRGPNGAIIPTEWIDVYDTELLSSAVDDEYDGAWNEEDDEETDLEDLEMTDVRSGVEIIEEMRREQEIYEEPSCAESEFSTRYHVQVTL